MGKIIPEVGNWRPDNWNAEEIVRQALGRRYNPFASEIRIAEAGADAMLDELKKQGQYGAGVDFENPAIECGKKHTGWLVFIPDEGGNK